MFLALLGDFQGFEEVAEASACRLDQQGIAGGFCGSVGLDQLDEALLDFKHEVVGCGFSVRGQRVIVTQTVLASAKPTLYVKICTAFAVNVEGRAAVVVVVVTATA